MWAIKAETVHALIIFCYEHLPRTKSDIDSAEVKRLCPAGWYRELFGGFVSAKSKALARVFLKKPNLLFVSKLGLIFHKKNPQKWPKRAKFGDHKKM